MRRTAVSLLAAGVLAGCAAVSPPVAPAAPVALADTGGALAAERIKPFQYLYGSAEGAALSIQTYHAMAEFARAAVANRPRDSVVLAADPGPGDARFVPCGDKPFAAVLDVDETALLNLGYEAIVAEGRDSRDVFRRWQSSGSGAVAPVPGALYAVEALRALGVKVIFNSNRDAETGASTMAQLTAAGFGPTARGDTLFLRGDADGQSGKDGRRAAIAETYCVIAMAGDQLGDFADLFNARDLAVPARRALAGRGWATRLWGEGWFLLPNPVYGPAMRGGIDDVFPADKRWDDPDKETN